jgi:hypothetical protein
MFKATVWMDGFTRKEQFETAQEAINWVYGFEYMEEFVVVNVESGEVVSES